MKLSKQAIDEFKSIYEEERGQQLSDDAAQEVALRLLTLIELLSESLSPSS